MERPSCGLSQTPYKTEVHRRVLRPGCEVAPTRVLFDRRGSTDALGGVGDQSRGDSCLPPALGLDAVPGKDTALRRTPAGN
ncbi:hypothetical protein NDU88_003147 [Pleurodeles waltl]|uniref:Uncharacterized protein n=1 Tax=Pleurodeles waltl TaxID=8319 RepID=A0AAV7MQX9_PLEWA|nr:hypothetical protein NDU88_003147 [Pleurodeles waltl]